MKRVLWLVTVVALAPARGGAQRALAAALQADTAAPEPIRRAAGCYALDPGPWERDSALAWLVPVAHLPRCFRLPAELLPPADNSPHAARFYQVGRVPSDTGALPFMAPLSAWEIRAPSGVVWVGQPLPVFGGAYLTLAPASGDPGGVLAGTITGFTDDRTRLDRESFVTRPLRARRIPCGAVPEPAGHGAPVA